MLIWFRLDGARERQEGVLVHCLAGISRSVTITVVSRQINNLFGPRPGIMFFSFCRLTWCTKCRWAWTTLTTLCAGKSPIFRPILTLWASCWISNDNWIRRVQLAAHAISRPMTAISRKITPWSRLRDSRSKSRKTRKSYLHQPMPTTLEQLIPVFRRPFPCRQARLALSSLPRRPSSILRPPPAVAVEASSACARSFAAAKPPSPSAILPPRPLCKLYFSKKKERKKHAKSHQWRPHPSKNVVVAVSIRFGAFFFLSFSSFHSLTT